jgi:hypothetical protein
MQIYILGYGIKCSDMVIWYVNILTASWAPVIPEIPSDICDGLCGIADSVVARKIKLSIVSTVLRFVLHNILQLYIWIKCGTWGVEMKSKFVRFLGLPSSAYCRAEIRSGIVDGCDLFQKHSAYTQDFYCLCSSRWRFQCQETVH